MRAKNRLAGLPEAMDGGEDDAKSDQPNRSPDLPGETRMQGAN
jgi:hypothetical protein